MAMKTISRTGGRSPVGAGLVVALVGLLSSAPAFAWETFERALQMYQQGHLETAYQRLALVFR